MKNILSNINAYVSFLGIIIKSSTAISISEQKRITSTEESITNLNRTEESTENILTPSGMARPRRWLKLPRITKRKEETVMAGAATLKDKIFVKKNPILKLGGVGSFLKNIALYLLNMIIHVAKSLSSKEKMVELFSSLFQKIKNQLQKISQFYINLSYKNKIFFTVFLVVIILFAVNTLVVKNNNDKVENQERYNSLVSAIEQKQNQLEANLLYNNTEGANTIIGEIKNLLNELPKETEEQNQEYSLFNEKLDQQLEKIRNVYRVDDSIELANFSNLNSNANSKNIIFSESNNKIYAGDSDQNSIYIIDATNNVATTLTDLKLNDDLRLATPSQDNKIYYLSGERVVELDINSETIQILPINITSDTKDSINIDSYSGRVYALNIAANQIYKFNRSNQAFSAGVPWIINRVDLSQAVDLSIDGHIYILLENGEVLKFLKGEKQELTLAPVEPAIEKATEFFVSPELKFIYILEPTNKRLIIYDKTGKFILQYKADKFDNLKDFSVDEKNQIIYFLNGNSVYKAEGKHF